MQAIQWAKLGDRSHESASITVYHELSHFLAESLEVMSLNVHVSTISSIAQSHYFNLDQVCQVNGNSQSGGGSGSEIGAAARCA